MFVNDAKILVVRNGSILEKPRVCQGLVKEKLSASEYLILHEDGSAKAYSESEVFVSLPNAHRHQVELLAGKISSMKVYLTNLEQSYNLMTA